MNEGRLTCSWKVTGTNTFRLASAKFLGFYGTNLTNSTESLMRCVKAPPGRKFIQPDQAGAEALVVAMETRPGKFRRLFDLGIKPHSYMALQLFTDKFRGNYPASRYKGVDPDVLKGYPECKDLLTRIKNSPDEYFLGKKTIHSFNYDEGPRTFQVTTLEESAGAIVLSFKESKEFKAIWGETFPEIIEQQAITTGKLAATRVLRNLFGYPRRFTWLWNDEVVRQGLAFVPQSTVGCITHLAFTDLFWRIKRESLSWKLLNNKHDSLLLEVPENEEEQAIAYCKEHMGRDLVSGRGEHYRMKVGVSVGSNWGHYDEKENPLGLREL